MLNAFCLACESRRASSVVLRELRRRGLDLYRGFLSVDVESLSLHRCTLRFCGWSRVPVRYLARDWLPFQTGRNWSAVLFTLACVLQQCFRDRGKEHFLPHSLLTVHSATRCRTATEPRSFGLRLTETCLIFLWNLSETLLKLTRFCLAFSLETPFWKLEVLVSKLETHL